MSEFNSVSSQNYDTSSADAVQRTRQIAAKIYSGVETTATKRALEDVQATIGLPDAKKLAISDEKGIVQQLASIQAQRAVGGMANAITVEEWKVPDKMVGLIIGQGGEQITRLQADSGCKVQMAADSGGLPERICTLTGVRQSIEKAKELMTAIINRGGPPLPVLDTNHVPDGHSIVEMMIPGPKVDLVIGKGGETIRNLQERATVKMVLIQDGPQQISQEKPLRITGEPDKCEYAKQLVMDLITEKELESLQRGGFEGTSEYGSSAGGQRSGNTHEATISSDNEPGKDRLEKMQITSNDKEARCQKRDEHRSKIMKKALNASIKMKKNIKKKIRKDKILETITTCDDSDNEENIWNNSSSTSSSDSEVLPQLSPERKSLKERLRDSFCKQCKEYLYEKLQGIKGGRRLNIETALDIGNCLPFCCYGLLLSAIRD